MNTIVIYTSKTGFTKKYAEWISAALGCECKSLEAAKKMSLNNIELIIYGGSLMASKIRGLDKLNKLAPKTKRVVFATGLTMMSEEKKIKDMVSANHLENIPFYYFEGGVNYDKTGFFSTKILKAVGKSASKEGNDELAKRFAASCDYTKQTYIEQLVQMVKNGSF